MKKRPITMLLTAMLVVAVLLSIAACQRAARVGKDVDNHGPDIKESTSQKSNGTDDKAAGKQDQKSRYLAPVAKNAGFSLVYGYADQQGNRVIEPQFSMAQPFYACGVAVVADKNNKVGLIDEKGTYLVEPQYDYFNYSEGLFLGYLAESDMTIAFDEKGKKQFEITGYIGEFNDGLFPYRNGNTRGYMDKTGKLVIDMKMESFLNFSNGMAQVAETYGGPSYYIDTKGNDLTDKISSGLRMFKNEATSLYGYKDKEGKIVVEAQYSDAKPFFNGFAVINAGKNTYDPSYGIIDTQGNIVLEPVYCGIERMQNGLIVVGEDRSTFDHIPDTYLFYSKKAVFSPDLKKHTDWIFYSVENFNDQYVCVNDDKTISFLDSSLKPAKDFPQFLGQGSFREDGHLLRGELNYHQTVADLKGNVLARAKDRIDLGDGLEAVTHAETRDNSHRLLYPVLSGFKDTAVQEKINAIIIEDMVRPYRPMEERDPSNLEIAETDYAITRQKNLLLIDQDIYVNILGSVHGMSFRNTLYISSQNGDEYELNDLFKPGEAVYSHLSEVVSAVMKEKMDEVGYWEDHVTITPDTCFALEEDGIVLYFAAYELASYAAGMQEFSIPFADLKAYIDTQGDFWKSFN